MKTLKKAALWVASTYGDMASSVAAVHPFVFLSLLWVAGIEAMPWGLRLLVSALWLAFYWQRETIREQHRTLTKLEKNIADTIRRIPKTPVESTTVVTPMVVAQDRYFQIAKLQEVRPESKPPRPKA